MPARSKPLRRQKPRRGAGVKAWVTIERGARCPKCGGRSRVYRSTSTSDADILRERYCPRCVKPRSPRGAGP